MRTLDNRLPPPVVAALTALGMWVLAHWLPILKFDVPWPVLTGFSVVCIGAAISIAGIREFKRAKTTVDPLHPERASSMVTTGVYRFTRNPMYLGILLALLGCFVGFGGVSAALGLPAFIWYITRFQIGPEERVLQAKFDSEYIAYKARARRWL